MSSHSLSLVTKFAAAGALAGLAFAAPHTSTAEAASGLRCEIDVAQKGSAVTLRGLVFSKQNVAGTYRFTVTKQGSGGGSDINQSGDFSTGGGSASVATVTLGGDGGVYTARLDVTADGATVRCKERAGGSL